MVSVNNEADLHVHSAMSDGTDTPEAVAQAAHSAGLRGFALTDHDTMRGWDDARAAAARLDLVFIPGIEISTRLHGNSVHVLAYWVDPHPSAALSRRLEEVRASRKTRARSMVEAIAADHPITWEGVCEIADGHGVSAESIGRPHIADALIAAGVVRDRSEAFASILAADSPYYVQYDAIDTVEAIDLVHEAGGVSVLAHGLSSGRGWEGVGADGVATLARAGLDGVEVEHREHGDAERALLRDLAHRFDLICTGGSDYHGSGKPNRIGENLTMPDQLEALYSRASTNA